MNGPFIFMGMGAGDLEGGHFFYKSTMGGAYISSQWGGDFFLAALIFKKPAKPNFLRVLGKSKTKKTSKKTPWGEPLIFGNFGRGHLFLARFANKNLRPPVHK